MPIDPTETPATPTTRRSFLVRAALGGALVTAGTAAGPLSSVLPAAAQDGTTSTSAVQSDNETESAPDTDATASSAAPDMDNATFAALAVPMEMAAVQAYHAAIAGETLDDTWSSQALAFQNHHQTVVDTYTPWLEEGTSAPVPDPTIVSSTVDAVAAAPDQDAVLSALADMENVLAATGLYAIGGLAGPTSAKAVAQVMAVESQQAVVLGQAVGTDLETLTPAVATTEGAQTNFAEAFEESTTTTTSAPAATTTTTTKGSY